MHAPYTFSNLDVCFIANEAVIPMPDLLYNQPHEYLYGMTEGV
jgi:hypothetical protein